MGYGFLLAASAAVCWGLSPILQKHALKDMGLLELNAVRGAGLLACLLPFLFFAGGSAWHIGAKQYLTMALMAILNNIVGDLFLFVAIRDIGVTLASPITSAYPLIVALISWRWFGEEMTPNVLAGTLAVVAGLVLLNLCRKSTEESAPSGFYLRGVVSAAIAAFCWALGLTLNKYLLLDGMDPAVMTLARSALFGFMSLSCWGGLVLMRPGSLAHAKEIPFTSYLSGAGAGIVALLVGGWLFSSSLSTIPLSIATPVASTSPLIAALIACVFMNERLRPAQWLGIVFVAAGAVFVGWH